MKNHFTANKIKYIIGFLIALLTAAMSYMSTSCSLTRTSTFKADSLHVQKIEIEKQFNSLFQK